MDRTKSLIGCFLFLTFALGSCANQATQSPESSLSSGLEESIEEGFADEDFGGESFADESAPADESFDEFAMDEPAGTDEFGMGEEFAEEDFGGIEDEFSDFDDLDGQETLSQSDVEATEDLLGEEAIEDFAPAEDELAFEDEALGNENNLPAENVGDLGGDDFATMEPSFDSGADFVAGPAVEVTALKYLANQNGGTVAIETSGPATYTSRMNAGTNQFVLEIPNATIPKSLKRPFITTEFRSVIGSIQAYDNPDSQSARVVLQLREQIEPKVEQTGNTILVLPYGDSAGSVPVMMAEEDEDVEIDPSVADGSKVLAERSMEDFLSETGKFYGRKISLQIKDGNVRDVLNFIAEESGLNMVVSEDVKGTISLKLREIPWDQALLVILKTKKLGYARQGNVVRISPLARLQEESDEAKKVLDSKKLLEPLMVRVLPVSYSDVEDLVKHAKEFVSKRGKVIADKRSQALIVKDIAENIERVAQLVRSLDNPPPQVLIEGKIVEATENFSRSMGINWNWSNGSFEIGGGASMEPALSTNTTSSTIGLSQGLDLDVTMGTFETFGSLGATLQLSERENKVKILSSPRIVTVNNEPGEIRQITQIPFLKITVTDGQVQRTIEYQEAALEMKVTPQITVDGGVMLQMDVRREFFGAVVDQELQSRPLNKRNAKTRILVKNGQTAVIGGLYQTEFTESEGGIPWLRKIPLLGALFEGSDIKKDKSELLIFLTPRILNYKSAFGKKAQ